MFEKFKNVFSGDKTVAEAPKETPAKTAQETCAPIPASVETELLDLETGAVFCVRVSGDGALPLPLDVRIFDHGTPKARLRAAFSSQINTSTLRRDLQALEAVNDLARQALCDAGEEKHIPAFDALWAAERTRLEDRWAEIEASGVDADQVMFEPKRDSTVSLGLFYRHTAVARLVHYYNTDDTWGTCVNAHDASSERRSVHRKYFLPLTQENLSDVKQLSGHQKLELLSEAKSDVYKQLVAQFDERRLSKWSKPRAVDADNAVADRDYLLFFDGRMGHVAAQVHSGGRVTYDIELHDAKPHSGINLDRFRKPLKLRRNVTNDGRFPNKEALDKWTRALIETVLCLDPDLPKELFDTLGREPFDPDHPLLAGLTIPSHHQEIIGIILGQPYARAAAEAERLVASKAKKAAKVKEQGDLAKTVVDGAIFGRVDRRKDLDGDHITWSMCRTKLFQIRTISPSGARRKRAMQEVRRHFNDRPVTSKQLARLPQLTSADALRLAHDFYFTGKRHVAEPAFQLSFHLDPGSENPFLQQAGSEVLLEGAEQVHSSYVDAGQHRVLSLNGVCKTNFWVERVEPKTNAGLNLIAINDMLYLHARPALDGRTTTTPKEQYAALSAALQAQTNTYGFDTRKALELFEQDWAKMAKKYG